jgi:hypothetical protein
MPDCPLWDVEYGKRASTGQHEIRRLQSKADAN